MAPEKLNSQQRARLNRSIQAGLDLAATSLKMMLGGEIHIGVVTSSARPDGVSVRLGMSGALEGGLYIDLPENMAVKIVKTLSAGREISLLDDIARSSLMELGNVLASVFVGYFDQYPGLRTLPSPPDLSLVPLDIPVFAGLFHAELCWTKSSERAEVLIGLERSALDILLAG